MLSHMTRIIRRTITTTTIETLTLIWVHTDDDDKRAPNETATDPLGQSHIITCSFSRVTTSCHTTILPAYVPVIVEEEMQ